MAVRPLHDRIIVRIDAEADPKSGGMTVRDTAKEHPHQGTAIGAGDRTLKDAGTSVPLEVETGEVIVSGRYGRQDVRSITSCERTKIWRSSKQAE